MSFSSKTPRALALGSLGGMVHFRRGVKADETPEQVLKRNLKEELDIEAVAQRTVMYVYFSRYLPAFFVCFIDFHDFIS